MVVLYIIKFNSSGSLIYCCNGKLERVAPKTVQNMTDTSNAGNIRSTLEAMKNVRFVRTSKLLVTNKPLVIKNISTAIAPKLMPRKFLTGSKPLSPKARA